MKVQDRRGFNVLIVLIGVLGLTLWFGYGINRPPTPSAVPAPVPAAQSAAAPEAGARIRLDLVESLHAEDEIGRNNLFQYRTRRAGPPDSDGSSGAGAAAPIPPPVVIPPAPSVPAGPPPPAPPPPIPFKYHGFAVVDEPRSMTAFLGDDTTHYNVTVGEVLMGRYRISRITDSDVEVEDLQFNRRQTLPLIR